MANAELVINSPAAKPSSAAAGLRLEGGEGEAVFLIEVMVLSLKVAGRADAARFTGSV
jgi:hypothetical protein